MKKFFGGFIGKLCLIMALLFTACGNGKQPVTQDTSQEASLSICTESVDKPYIMDYKNAQITPDFKPLSTSFCVSGDKLYFVDNQGAGLQSICEVPLTGEDKPAKLPIDLSEASVDVLTVKADNSGVSTIYCMGRTLAENNFLAAYSHEGEQLFRKDFDENLSKALRNNVAYKLALDGEGNIYALSSACLYLFDKTGEYQGEAECPGKGYCSVASCGDEVYVTYQDIEGNKTEIAKVQFAYKNLTDAKELLGDGALWKGQGNTVLTCDGSALYSCDMVQEKVVKLLDFATHDVIGSELQAAVQKESGEPVLVSWKLLNQNKPVELLSFREAKEGEEIGAGKQVITILCVYPFIEDSYEEAVVEFNKQSADYKVVFEIIPTNGISMNDIYAAVNTRLMADESADLLFMLDYYEITRYQEKGLLEDLTPYIEKSEVVGEEDFLEDVIEGLKIDGRLYGMSKDFNVETLIGRVSEVGERAGWTVEEMLQWLKEHPGTKSYLGLTKEMILEYCLKGDLDTYVDWEQGKAAFDDQAFYQLLSAINELETDDTQYYDDLDKLNNTDNAVLGVGSVATFSDVTGIMRAMYEGEMTEIGYPTANGTPKYIMSTECMSILSRSKCKEGAYAFLEYYMTMTPADEYADLFYIYQEAFDAAKERAVASLAHPKPEDDIWGVREMPLEEREELIEKKVDEMLEVMDYMVIDDYASQTIRTIVIEEAQAYFAGDKTLEDTCRVIQSRVQLYLDENS